MRPLPITLDGVREHAEGLSVELAVEATTGRLVIRAKNEGGFNVTEVDLWDLIDWLREWLGSPLIETTDAPPLETTALIPRPNG